MSIYICTKSRTHDMQELSLCSPPEDCNEYGSESDLLVTTLRTIYQVANLIREMDIDRGEELFYGSLSRNCIRLQECIARVSHVPFRVDMNLINIALCQLCSLIAETGFQETPSNTTTLRLNMFNAHWNNTRDKDDKEKIDFIRKWLRPGLTKEYLNCINKSLEECADKLERQQPENLLLESGNQIARDHDGPSYGLWRTAQALFDALQQCGRCSCSEQHEFKARLELGTYRKPSEPAQDTIVPRYARRRILRQNNSATGVLDFGMFLSREREWHEIRVQAVKKRVVGFAVDDQVMPACDSTRRVKKLCKLINSTRPKPRHRFVLKLTSGQLFNEGMEGSSFWINQAAEPISLLRCFEERHDVFTEKIKRILSLIIGYAVLHLSGTSWLQSAWGSRDIKFFQTTSGKTPLRPFIQVHLPKASQTPDVEIDNESDEDAVLDDVNSGHHCPALIALAVVLLEIHFAKPFHKLAQKSGIPLEGLDSHIMLLDVDQVFNGSEENKVEGWRSQIPEDSPLLTVIDNCLNLELWEDDERSALDNPMLKTRIYDDIVRPLELHLTTGFSKIPLDDVDNYARNLDLGQWGESSANHDLHGVTAASFITSSSTPRSLTPINAPSAALALMASNQDDARLVMPELQGPRPNSGVNGLPPLSHLTTALGSDFQPEATGYKTHQFFDDEIGDGQSSIKKHRDYLNWRSEYLNVYHTFIETYLPIPCFEPVKIAILDTGIDRGHDAFEAREDAIKERLNYHNESQGSIRDLNGHGTFTASLILDYAPDAELYIIKIADQNARPSAEVVAKAINHAIDEWDVDIISMSFGWPSSDFDGYNVLESAVHKAYCKKVLLFSAASHDGRLDRAYPASSSQVICVHSTDTLGNASAFSPTALPFTLNFATVGESVESAWPTHLCHDQSTSPKYVQSRSGTSYATPIMAGIAAFLLQYARIHLSAEEAQRFKSKENMEALLKRCAERGPNYAMRDGYFYVELSLNRHNLFGGRLEDINYEISKTLQK